MNLAQTKVNRSLVYDLLDYEKRRSPQKSAHHVAVALDQVSSSPFFRRIKRLGRATQGREGEKEPLTQAAVVEMLLTLITDDPMADRDSFLRRLVPRRTQEDIVRWPFRGLFLAEKEKEITRIMLNYFGAVRSRWPESWDDLDRQGNVLPDERLSSTDALSEAGVPTCGPKDRVSSKHPAIFRDPEASGT